MHFVAAKVFFFLVENVEIFDQILDDIKYDGSGWFDIVRESFPVGVESGVGVVIVVDGI